ncbi:hypothetical protein VPNG_08963 [Cytospora leucostoma]|uniref:Uncharacterized protein n=1 Tax=Cytospora leucostoma TaxID=1230097 RepID=A0A423VWC8_9PEZI|nr:hypothetical protein VPNG_08963 [Cytospora leucostoma]
MVLLGPLAQPPPAQPLLPPSPKIIHLLIEFRQTRLTFNGNPSDQHDPWRSQTWMYARDARQQQAGVPAGQALPYPSTFSNHEQLPLSTPGTYMGPRRGQEWLHYPLKPGRPATWTPSSGQPAGAVRSFYTAGNPNQFDVGYHLPAPKRTNNDFELANYHAAVPQRRAPTA